MRRILRILARIAGSFGGMLVGGALLTFPTVVGCNYLDNDWDTDARWLRLIISGLVAILVGAVIGAAAGATITHRILRQRSSFRKAFIGAAIGLLVGLLPAALSCLALLWHPAWHPAWWLPADPVVAIVAVCVTTVFGAVTGSGWKAKPGAEAQS
jgi:drug/metabolite transporter (DMT)-like permease